MPVATPRVSPRRPRARRRRWAATAAPAASAGGPARRRRTMVLNARPRSTRGIRTLGRGDGRLIHPLLLRTWLLAAPNSAVLVAPHTEPQVLSTQGVSRKALRHNPPIDENPEVPRATQGRLGSSAWPSSTAWATSTTRRRLARA